ncbi:BspA family leucine-rich repeat surface protein [Williamsoniiplasma luminosum]|uniref:BspA family leucine-rich repeat surface protein n=1 Tax=Williamsoniiplasma luminosum TaxID=214888 RepID=A0A2S0NJX0_9MOLU|nr:BspA family leucine-rich repeat surface protein [Williamsoniiplasma luminosum]AVP49314.1 MAG: hypothetical protein C5T88_01825 [Williamsoniiplasma luminosum]
MKKILSILGSAIMLMSVTTTVVACGHRIDVKKSIASIEQELQSVLSEKKSEAWELKDLQTQIDKKYGAKEILVEIVSSSGRAFHQQLHENRYKFIGNATIDNLYKYQGDIVLTHQWNKAIGYTKDISEIKTQLQEIVNSQEEYWTNDKLEKAIVEKGLDISKGIIVSEGMTNENPKELPVKKWHFAGQGTIDNDYKYHGSFEILQVENKIDRNDTIYIDVKTNEIQSITASAPEGTQKIINIGWDNNGHVYKMPSTILEVPNYISSKINSMKEMFSNASVFNGDISNWDVSNVTDMNKTFHRAKAFNGDISNWNTSKVTTMEDMFWEAWVFNQDITRWNTTNVTNMRSVFQEAWAFNQNLKTNGDSWNTSKVDRMDIMFDGAKAFNGDISNWNTSNVTNMERMFKNASEFNQNLKSWDVKKVKNHKNFDTGAKKWEVDNKPNF